MRKSTVVLVFVWLVVLLGLIDSLSHLNDADPIGLAAKAGASFCGAIALILLLVTVVVARATMPRLEKPSDAFSQTHGGEDIDGRGTYSVKDQLNKH